MHLIVDCAGHVENEELLRNPHQLRQCLCEMAEVAKMHVLTRPEIIDYPFPGQKGTALSAVAFLGESAMVVHTYPEWKSIFIDIFHCHPFDVTALFRWILDKFRMNANYVSTYLFDRGIDANGRPIWTAPLKWSSFEACAQKVEVGG